MLRLSVENEEYLMVGDNVKIIFLGGTGNHHRIMIDAPKEVKIVRSKAIKKYMKDKELAAKFPTSWKVQEKNKTLTQKRKWQR